MHDSIMVGNYDSFLMSRVIVSRLRLWCMPEFNVLDGYAKVMSIIYGNMFA